MITTHYRCILDIIQPVVDNDNKDEINDFKSRIDETIEEELRNAVHEVTCDDKGSVTIERVTLEFTEE